MTMPSALSGASASYLEYLYRLHRETPGSVDYKWGMVFDVLDDLGVLLAGPAGASLVGAACPDELNGEFRDRGHLRAALDPLKDGRRPEIRLAGLEALYCGTLSLETAHIDDAFVRTEARRRFEARPALPSSAARLRAFELLVGAEEFERAIGKRYPAKKRFGAEGAEALLPLFDRILSRAAVAGVRRVFVGAMHRGRLSMLANVLEKPLDALFDELVGKHSLRDHSQPADVPYHLGYHSTLNFDGSSIEITLLPNPSHLEAVNAVAVGRTRAWQDEAGVADAMCVLLHTDASVIGQGSVAELIQMSGIEGFRIGGAVHLIVNNQIGFTTGPSEARTSRHCTGAWKAIDSPILHVNGDQVDDVLAAADLAFDLRTSHACDVVVDLVCYRRNGHNEIDEPRLTQPALYAEIDRHPTAAALYQKCLIETEFLDTDLVTKIRSNLEARFGQALNAARERTQISSDQMLTDFVREAVETDTGIAVSDVYAIVRHLASLPAEIVLLPKLAKLVERRAVELSTGLPWATAEALAFGSLLKEGIPIRLSGQDVVRGAFSHRHFSLPDIDADRQHTTLDYLPGKCARLDIVNSPLSEYAVLAFEYGYSIGLRNGLTIWEAQFGDFANGAQIVIDQFITTGEAKWGQESRLIILLPHGLEGQGPEHSSARPERWLQLAARGNIEVVQPTTPANYFHLLRRQAKRARAVPLVVLSPKTLLRLPAAVSQTGDFGPHKHFEPVITSIAEDTEMVLICSGKVAYELEATRCDHVSVIRLEALYPLPEQEMVALFKRWPKARFRWVQEEPRNQGPWVWLDRQLEAILRRAGIDAQIECIAREAQVSTAGGFHGLHDLDQAELVARACARPITEMANPSVERIR